MSLKNLQLLRPLQPLPATNKRMVFNHQKKSSPPVRFPAKSVTSRSAESLAVLGEVSTVQFRPRVSRSTDRKLPSLETEKGKPQEGISGLRKAARSSSGSRNPSPTISIGRRSESLEQLERLNGHHPHDGSLHADEDNINVVVRLRPLSERERSSGDESVVEFPGNGQLLCQGPPGQKEKQFSYNVVFEPAATQEDVLEYSGIKRLLEMAVDGFSCTAFCYGQTGSGKTHTLTGPPGLLESHASPLSEDQGLIVRSFVYLFRLLQMRTDCNFVLKASYLEIYNEKVIDLLNPGGARKALQVRWSKESRSFYVENLFNVDCEELDDLFAVLEEGMRNRATGSHAMNEHSSRSHTLLTVRVRSERAADGARGVRVARNGKINFVDLAGSEMTKRTNSRGKTLEEANNINKSLMVLGYCIASLSDQKRKNHIPYRDSKLTKLLADSLAGSGVTLMIACISPTRSNLSETVNTLRYAARAKKIKTKPIIKVNARDALILSLRREVNVLQEENDHLRAALHVPDDLMGSATHGKRVMQTPPPVDLEKLAELESSELAELVKLYMSENQTLRGDNQELYQSRDLMMRDQELVCRENERLLKKLEDVNSVCCRSPIIPARPAYSELGSTSEMDSANIWTNPHGSSSNTSVVSNSS